MSAFQISASPSSSFLFALPAFFGPIHYFSRKADYGEEGDDKNGYPNPKATIKSDPFNDDTDEKRQ